MAGTLVITTLSDGTNSTSATNCIQGSAKAWVNFAGASGTRNSSYNVSSVTRNATGQYTINYTNAFSAATYCVVGTLDNNTMTFGASGTPAVVNGTNTTTTSVIWVGYTGSGSQFTANDYTAIGVAVFSS
jgi:hypothetical protein